MNTPYFISNDLETQVKYRLIARWFYFKSIGGALLCASYANDALSHSPHFIQISKAEYDELLKVQQS